MTDILLIILTIELGLITLALIAIGVALTYFFYYSITAPHSDLPEMAGAGMLGRLEIPVTSLEELEKIKAAITTIRAGEKKEKKVPEGAYL